MNRFKQKIERGERQIGLWQALANPYTAEICAGAGFDWLLIDGEHAPNDLPLILTQLQAVAAYPLEAVVRPPVGDPVLIKQLLDVGVQSLLVPMIEDTEQAEAMVKAIRYPPAGIRGIGSAIGRASRWNRTPDYLATAEHDLCLLLQIETVRGLNQIESIAAVEGVNGIFIGPSDLAASLGHIGRPSHPDVQGAIEGAFAAIARQGKPAGVLMADEALARHYLELGACFVAVGTDVTLLARGAEDLARRFGGTAHAEAGGVY